MKCISCGNLIPDATTVCPYCNSKVEPVAPAMPVYNVDPVQQTMAPNNMAAPVAPVESMNVVPETPVTPVLPQDQGLPVAPAEPIPAPVSEPVVAPAPVVETPVEPVTPVTPVAPAPVEPVTPVAPVAPTPVAPAEPVVQPTQPAEPITLEVGADGVKVGSIAPVTEGKKKPKVILFVIIGVLLVALIGGGIFFYMSQFKSSDKRIEAIVNRAFAMANTIKNDAIEKASGSYKIDLSVNANNQEIGTKLNGKYAYDLEKKLIDVTLNAESLNFGQELLDEPLSVEVYGYDSKVYVLLQNFYENYIFADVPNYDEFFAGIEQNDIDYRTIINAYKIAIKNGLTAATNTQSIEDVTVNGKKQKVNQIKMVLNSANQKKIVTSAYNSLMKNSKAIEEMAKLSNKDVEEVKEELKSGYEALEFDSEETATLEIYTAMFGEELVGIKLYGKNTDGKNSMFEVAPSNNGAKITFKEDNKEIISLNVTGTNKKTSTTKESTTSIEMVFYDDNQTANKIKATVGVTEDVNPVVEKVNTKNSVDYRYIPVADQQKIISNISNFGKLGLIFQQFMGNMMPQTPEVPTPGTDTPVTPVTPTN